MSIRINPNNPNTYYNFGATLYDMQDNEKALLYADKAIQLNNRYELAYNLKGIIAIKLGNCYRALKRY